MLRILINILAVIGGITVACAIFLVLILVIVEIRDHKSKKDDSASDKIPPNCSLNEENCIHPDDDWNCDNCEVYEEFKQIGGR